MDITTALKITNPILSKDMKLALLQHELEKACEKYEFALEYGDPEINAENRAMPFEVIQVDLDHNIYEDGVQRFEGALVVWDDGTLELNLEREEDKPIYSEGVIDSWLYSIDARDEVYEPYV